MSSEPVSRRELSAQATRAALLDSARAAFGARGYADVSLAEIARDARATTGALYHHFTDKRQLFAAVAESVEAEIVAHLSASAPRTADLWVSLAYAVTGTLDFAARPGITQIIFRDAPAVIGAEWREIELRHGFGTLNAILKALSAMGRLGSHDPAIVAGVILGALVQTAVAVSASDDVETTLAAGRAAMTQVIGAFRS